MSDFTIRPFGTLAEFQECVALQEVTWGPGFSERVPVALMKVSQRLGGVAAGAYDRAGHLAGFVFGVPGWEGDARVHWSDMLAVRPELRDTGLGTRLKAYQRDEVMKAGVERIYWTFDPLESRNANMNFSKLGIVVSEHVCDMYGQTDSPLHRGIGTDRFVAKWLLGTDRVARRLSGEERPPSLEQLDGVHRVLTAASSVGDGPLTPGERIDTEAARALVAIPADIQALKADSLETAAAWRHATRAIFVDYVERGYEVRELVRDGPLSHYLLEKP